MAIETTKYFNGEIELTAGVWYMPRREFAERFPGVKGRPVDSVSLFVGSITGDRTVQPVTRIIDYKRNPSRPKCDARCMNAKGRTCECSCGGKNHGLNDS